MTVSSAGRKHQMTFRPALSRLVMAFVEAGKTGVISDIR